MKAVFLDSEGKVRSGWRAAAFLAAWIFAALLSGSMAFAVITVLQLDATPGSNLFLAINGVLSLIPAIVLGWLGGRYFENLPFAALGAAPINGWLKHWVIGLIVGGMTLLVAILPAFLFGGLTFATNEAPIKEIAASMAVSFGVFALAAAFEEALFRGYVLQTLDRAGYAWLAIALTSVFFAAVHLGNPNATAISTLNTLLAGVWFGLAYLKTRDLWFVWGMHLMWNWMQGSVFGIEVSGLTSVTTAPLLKEIDAGPTWLTGETYGIEGGVACTVALLLSIVAIRSQRILTADNADDADKKTI